MAAASGHAYPPIVLARPQPSGADGTELRTSVDNAPVALMKELIEEKGDDWAGSGSARAMLRECRH